MAPSLVETPGGTWPHPSWRRQGAHGLIPPGDARGHMASYLPETPGDTRPHTSWRRQGAHGLIPTGDARGHMAFSWRNVSGLRTRRMSYIDGPPEVIEMSATSRNDNTKRRRGDIT